MTRRYVSPSGRYAWTRLGPLWWQRMDGRLSAVGIAGRILWHRGPRRP